MPEPTAPTPTPVTILTGFLGAGKTTLLNRILRGDHRRRIAVIVNDFGDIDIDARLVDSIDGQTLNLSNGCICCDRRGDLRLTLRTLLAREEPPDLVIVEASGISDPVAIVSTLHLPDLRDRVRIDGVIALVDAEHARDPRLDEQLISDQIRVADIVILNKIDVVRDDVLLALDTWIGTLARDARIVHAMHANVALPLVLNLDSGPRTIRRTDANIRHTHGAEYSSWSFYTAEYLDLHRTVNALKTLPSGVFRGKGILALADAPRLRLAIHVVGRRISTEILGPWGSDEPHTDLVFIGMPGATDDENIRSLFASCVAGAVPTGPAR